MVSQLCMLDYFISVCDWRCGGPPSSPQKKTKTTTTTTNKQTNKTKTKQQQTKNKQTKQTNKQTTSLKSSPAVKENVFKPLIKTTLSVNTKVNTIPAYAHHTASPKRTKNILNYKQHKEM